MGIDDVLLTSAIGFWRSRHPVFEVQGDIGPLGAKGMLISKLAFLEFSPNLKGQARFSRLTLPRVLNRVLRPAWS